MARKKQQRKGRTSEQSIDRSGRHIYEKGGQIKPLTDRRRDVESQSRDASIPITWPGKGCGCKRMAAAGYMLLKETVSSPKGKLIIGEVGLKCHECGKGMC